MITDVKEILIESPDKIVELLEYYDFSHIKKNEKEIRFARNEAGGQNISIRLENNPGIYVKDFVTTENIDIVGFIINQRGETFINVLTKIKNILGLGDDWRQKETSSFFCGFYDKIGSDTNVENIEEYNEDVMDKYDKIGNKRWIRDGISLKTQRKYCVCYDRANDLIVFPWRNASTGRIMAVKARVNYEITENGMKYFYVKQGKISSSLFGYSENYADLLTSDKVIVVEGEKSVMLIDQWGFKNAVAIGSHSLSDQQAKLIMSLSPKEVWFMLDKDLPIEETEKNIKILREYMMMKNCKIKYWDWTRNATVCEKGSPVDMGEIVFADICKNEMENA